MIQALSEIRTATPCKGSMESGDCREPRLTLRTVAASFHRPISPPPGLALEVN